jgi:glycosyl transferase family 25
MTMQALVINVKCASARMAFQKEQLTRMGIAWKRLPAVTLDDIQMDPGDTYWDGWQRPIAPTERACLRSHMACWQIVYDNSAPCLILEDDALLADDLSAVLTAASQIKDLDLLQLETRNRAKLLGVEIFDAGPIQARALLIDRAGAAGYVLWPMGARKLLDYTARTPGLADSIIAKPGLLRAAQVVPAQVIQNDMAELYDVPQEWSSETSSVSSAFHRKARKSPAQTLRRIMAQLSLGSRQLGRGEKMMVPFGKRTSIQAITTKTSSCDDVSP